MDKSLTKLSRRYTQINADGNKGKSWREIARG